MPRNGIRAADGNDQETKTTDSFITSYGGSFKPPYGMPIMIPLRTISPPSPQMTTPYGRPRRDSDDLKYKSPRFGMRMAAAPRVTMIKLRPLRITSDRCLPPTSSLLLTLQFPPFLMSRVKCPYLSHPSPPKKWQR